MMKIAFFIIGVVWVFRCMCSSFCALVRGIPRYVFGSLGYAGFFLSSGVFQGIFVSSGDFGLFICFFLSSSVFPERSIFGLAGYFQGFFSPPEEVLGDS